MRTWLITILLLVPIAIGFCQTSAKHQIDSLLLIAKSLVGTDPDSSLSVTLKARKIAIETKDSAGVAEAFYMTSTNYYFRGRLMDALHDFEIGRAIVEKLDDKSLLAKTYGLAANFEGAAANRLGVLSNYRKALKVFTEMGDEIGQAQVLYNLLNAFLIVQDLDSAKFYFDQLIPLTPRVPLTMRALITMSKVRYALAGKDYESARRAIKEIGEIKTAREQGLVEMFRYEIAMHDRTYKKAEQHIYKAIDHFKRAKNPGAMYQFGYANLPKVFEAQGKFKEAFDELQKYQDAISNMEYSKIGTTLELLQSKEEANSLTLKQNRIMKLKQENELQRIKISRTNIILLSTFIVVVFGVIIFLLWSGRSKSLMRRQLLEKDLHIALKDEQLAQKELVLLDSEKRAAELKLTALRSQMNPHFIFNALNSIQACISDNRNQVAIKYLAMFSKLIRTVLRESHQPLVELRKEIETLKLYIGLESLRFSNSIAFELNVQHDLIDETMKVPSFLVQPFIENAIKHAFNTSSQNKRVDITIAKNQNTLQYEIIDNGVGFEHSKTVNIEEYKSMGISLVKEKLATLNRTDCKLDIQDLRNEHGMSGTRVLIEMPVTY